MEGEVEKLGGKFRNKWQKRHLKLYNDVLLYGKEKSGVFNINGEVSVETIGACIHKENGMGKKNSPGFELKVIDQDKNVRTFQFSIPDPDKCNEWVQIIKECINTHAQKKRQKKLEQRTNSNTTNPKTDSPTATKSTQDEDEKTAVPIRQKVVEEDEEELRESGDNLKTMDVSDSEDDMSDDDVKSTTETENSQISGVSETTRSMTSAKTDVVCIR
jgi:hypothetical protein